MQIQCTQCHRLLEVPDSQAALRCACPGCSAQFVLRSGRIESCQDDPHSGAIQVQTTAPPDRRRRNKLQSLHVRSEAELSIQNPDWKLAKYTFGITVVIRVLIAGLVSRDLDSFLLGAVFAPVTAIPVAVIAVLTKGIVFGWGQKWNLPRSRWLLGALALGFILGAAFGCAITAQSNRPTVTVIVGAGFGTGMVGAFGLLLLLMWTVAVMQALRDIGHKIEKAGQPDHPPSHTVADQDS